MMVVKLALCQREKEISGMISLSMVTCMKDSSPMEVLLELWNSARNVLVVALIVQSKKYFVQCWKTMTLSSYFGWDDRIVLSICSHMVCWVGFHQDLAWSRIVTL